MGRCRLYLTHAWWPSLEEEAGRLTTVTAAKSSWGQTLMSWVDLGLTAAATAAAARVAGVTCLGVAKPAVVLVWTRHPEHAWKSCLETPLSFQVSG